MEKLIGERIRFFRVLIYGQLPPPFHGTNIMTESFLRAVRELGYDVALCAKNFSRRIEEVNILRPAKAARYIRYFRQFFNEVRYGRPDVLVFFLSARPLGLAAELPLALLSRFFRVPYILYLHARGYGSLHARNFFCRAVIDRLFRPARACLVLGERLKKEIQSFSASSIFVLPNCLAPGELLTRVTGSDMIRIVYLSNLSESKGIRTLMDAIPKVIEAHQNVSFTIAGPWQDQSLKKEIFDFVIGRGLQGFVNFPGRVYEHEKNALLASSDIFVFPSHYPLEAMSLVVLEAMRAGLPVITSDIGALPEAVIDGLTGFVVPPKDPERLAEKILQLAGDPALGQRMGDAGRERFLARFSFSLYKSRVASIMADLFSSRLQ